MNSDPAQPWCPRPIYRHPGLNPACARRGAMARRGEDVAGRALARCSRLCCPDACRARIELDRSGGLELFAVEAEYHDLLLDHALGQKHAVALTPGKTLTPVADLGLGQRDQLVAFDAQHLHQAVVVEERIGVSILSSPKGLRCLTDPNGTTCSLGNFPECLTAHSARPAPVPLFPTTHAF